MSFLCQLSRITRQSSSLITISPFCLDPMGLFALSYLREFPLATSSMLVVLESAKAISGECENSDHIIKDVFVAFTYVIMVVEILYIIFHNSSASRPTPENVYHLDVWKAKDRLLKLFQFLKIGAVLGASIAGLYIMDVLNIEREKRGAVASFLFTILITVHLLFHAAHEKEPPTDERVYVKLLEGNVRWWDTSSSIVHKLERKAVRRIKTNEEDDSSRI